LPRVATPPTLACRATPAQQCCPVQLRTYADSAPLLSDGCACRFQCGWRRSAAAGGTRVPFAFCYRARLPGRTRGDCGSCALPGHWFLYRQTFTPGCTVALYSRLCHGTKAGTFSRRTIPLANSFEPTCGTTFQLTWDARGKPSCLLAGAQRHTFRGRSLRATASLARLAPRPPPFHYLPASSSYLDMASMASPSSLELFALRSPTACGHRAHMAAQRPYRACWFHHAHRCCQTWRTTPSLNLPR